MNIYRYNFVFVIYQWVFSLFLFTVLLTLSCFLFTRLFLFQVIWHTWTIHSEEVLHCFCVLFAHLLKHILRMMMCVTIYYIYLLTAISQTNFFILNGRHIQAGHTSLLAVLMNMDLASLSFYLSLVLLLSLWTTGYRIRYTIARRVSKLCALRYASQASHTRHARFQSFTVIMLCIAD